MRYLPFNGGGSCNRIELKGDANEKQLIDELRCRNGNLEIMCAVAADIEEQSF